MITKRVYAEVDRAGTTQSGSSPFWWYTVILAVATMDPFGTITYGGSIRYGWVLLCLVVIGFHICNTGFQIWRPRLGESLAMTLATYGLGGSIVGLILRPAGESSYLTVFASFLLLPAALIRVEWSSLRATKISSAMGRSGLVILVVHVVARGVDPDRMSQTFNHDLAFLYVAVVAYALLSRRYLMLGAAAVLCVIAIAQNPAATYVLTACIGLATWAVTARDVGKTSRAALGVGAVGFAVIFYGLAARSTRTSAVLASQFNDPNVDFRTQIWGAAFRRWQDGDQIFGSFFSGNLAMTNPVWSGPRAIPLHNDPLQMLVGGGIIGLALFCGWVAWTNACVLRDLGTQGNRAFVILQRTCLIGFNAGIASSVVNPIFSKVGLALWMILYFSIASNISRASATDGAG